MDYEEVLVSHAETKFPIVALDIREPGKHHKETVAAEQKARAKNLARLARRAAQSLPLFEQQGHPS